MIMHTMHTMTIYTSWPSDLSPNDLRLNNLSHFDIFLKRFSNNSIHFYGNNIYTGFSTNFKQKSTDRLLEKINFQHKKHHFCPDVNRKVYLRKTISDLTGMAQWSKCPGKDDFVKQPDWVNHTIPMQFGVVVVFAILPYTMSWLPLSPEIRCRD